MSRTKHHRDAISPRRYRLRDWPARLRALRDHWNLREMLRDWWTPVLPSPVDRETVHPVLSSPVLPPPADREPVHTGNDVPRGCGIEHLALARGVKKDPS